LNIQFHRQNRGAVMLVGWLRKMRFDSVHAARPQQGRSKAAARPQQGRSRAAAGPQPCATICRWLRRAALFYGNSFCSSLTSPEKRETLIACRRCTAEMFDNS
jgi:hypothetical protein